MRFEKRINGACNQPAELTVADSDVSVLEELCKKYEICTHLVVKQRDETTVLLAQGSYAKDSWKWWWAGDDRDSLNWRRLKVASDKAYSERLLFGMLNCGLLSFGDSEQVPSCLCSNTTDAFTVGEDQKHYWTCFLHRHEALMKAAKDINFAHIQKSPTCMWSVLVMEMDKNWIVVGLDKHFQDQRMILAGKMRRVIACVARIVAVADGTAATPPGLSLFGLPPGL